jgi:hypothetical protein
MTAGTAGFQTDAMHYLYAKVNRAGSNPGSSFSSIRVRDTATLYMDFCNEQRRIATDSLLAPYGLTAKDYIDKQKSMSRQFVRWITSEVEDIRDRFGGPALFCGMDDGGAHIFQCDGNILASCDSFAFAAIGSGRQHAESQFMLAGHTRSASMAETVLLTYVAKKRSQAAPGVGAQTEMFVIFANPSGWYYVQTHGMEILDAAYTTIEKRAKNELKVAQQQIEAMLKELQRAQPELGTGASPPSPT